MPCINRDLCIGWACCMSSDNSYLRFSRRCTAIVLSTFPLTWWLKSICVAMHGMWHGVHREARHAFAWSCMRSEMMHLRHFSGEDNTKGEETCKSSPPHPQRDKGSGGNQILGRWLVVIGGSLTQHQSGESTLYINSLCFSVDFGPSVWILREHGAK